MERFNPNMEIENNSAGLIEIIVENAVDSDLFETDEHDDSSDNIGGGIHKFLNTTLDLELVQHFKPKVKNQSIYSIFRLAKGFQNIDIPPPKFS